jgi:rubrerythrin
MTAVISFASLIDAIVRDPQLHARWLNTVSFLEYVGFRKIVKSQRAESLSAMVLTHALEEGRHALRLKKLAITLGGPSFDSYAPETLLCGEEAEDYFQALDHQCEAQFADCIESERIKRTYLYVTWLIERRALEVYETYQKAVAGSEIAQKLDGLLAEEVGHLRQVESEIAACDPQHATRAAKVIALEAALYAAFLAHLGAALAAEAAIG